MQDSKIEKDASGLKKKKMVLGKGLDALIPELEFLENDSGEYFQCDIDQIQPNRYQPRQVFSEDEMKELCLSVKTQGILQPLLVRPSDEGYELIAGERRLRAAKMAGLTQVPVVLKDISESCMLEFSIVENIQREDLNPLEEAEAYYRLMTEFHLTQEQVAARVGKSRPAVANFIRLRQLPDHIKETILDGTLSMGHARALLGAKTPQQQHEVWQAIFSKSLSVRETEDMIRSLKTETRQKKRPRTAVSESEEVYFQDLSDNFSRYFGTKVRIRRKGEKGKIEIDFYSYDDLDRLIHLLQSS